MSVTSTETHHVETVVDLLTQWSEQIENLTIESGETRTVDSGDTLRATSVENAGTLANQGTVDSGFDVWGATPPTIKRYWDDTQSEKGPGADMPAIIYVWSPTDSTLDRFSADGDKFEQSDTVEIQIWSLDESEPEILQRNVVTILSQYLDDNKIKTPYTDLAPVNQSDFREQKNARTTDYYIMSVEVETHGLSDTGLA